MAKEGLADQVCIDAHTEGQEGFRALVEQYDPQTASRICGIDEDTIRNVARVCARAGAAMTIWTMGINQSTHGSDGVVAINNLNLVTGNIGKPGGSSLSITGQCNAMGTREWSSCSGLPGYRALENDKDREVAGVAVFYNLLGAYAVLEGLPQLTGWLPAGLVEGMAVVAGWGAVLSRVAALYFMHRIYRIEARPFRDHWQVLSSCYGNMLTLGSLAVGLTAALLGVVAGEPYAGLLAGLVGMPQVGVVADVQ